MKKLFIIILIALYVSIVQVDTVFSVDNHVQGEVLVVFKSSSTLTSRRKIVTSVKAKTLKTMRVSKLRLRLLKVKAGNETQVINRLKSYQNVEAAGYNRIAKIAWVPNDPYYSSGSFSANQWNLNRINVANAWDTTKGSGALVAVVDTGLSRAMPDISYSRVVNGYDFVNSDSNTNDDNGHGTLVSSIIAASANNNKGMSGIAPEAKILPVKVLNQLGEGNDADIIRGLVYAFSKNANIINLSLTLGASSSPVKSVIDALTGEGVVVVAASGNDGVSTVSYPAKYDSAISVGSSNASNSRVSYSNYGSGLDFTAPGGDFTEEANGDGYSDGILGQSISSYDGLVGPASNYFWAEGTSMAAPHVSGLAALLFAQGARGATHVKQAMAGTATDLGTAGYDTTYGYGLINASAAVAFSKSRLTTKISKARIGFKQIVEVRGTLSPAQASTISLQTYDDKKGRWSTVKKVASAANGNYAGRLRLSYDSEVRADWSGTSSVLGQLSNSKYVDVKARVSIKPSVSRASSGTGIVISGKVAPRYKGTKIVFQRKIGRKWKTVDSTKLNAGSAYKKNLKLPHGSYIIRSLVRPSMNLPSASKPIRVIFI